MRHGSTTANVTESILLQGFFGRLFQKLAPLRLNEAYLEQLGSEMHAAKTIEPRYKKYQDNEDIPAGYTYFGQFVSHDITYDPTSSLDRENDPDRLHNFRTPRFDLDSIYGQGPDDSPFLYGDYSAYTDAAVNAMLDGIKTIAKDIIHESKHEAKGRTKSPERLRMEAAEQLYQAAHTAAAAVRMASAAMIDSVTAKNRDEVEKIKDIGEEASQAAEAVVKSVLGSIEDEGIRNDEDVIKAAQKLIRNIGRITVRSVRAARKTSIESSARISSAINLSTERIEKALGRIFRDIGASATSIEGVCEAMLTAAKRAAYMDKATSRLHMLIGKNANGEDDLPRNDTGRAIIGDPRNDVNILIAQMHVVFLKFHNQVVDDLIKRKFPGNIFAEARRIVTWHYQYVVMNDYVERLVGKELLESKIKMRRVEGTEAILPKKRLQYFKWKHQIYMPIEFAAAAYRFGHSMVREQYALNDLLQKTTDGITYQTKYIEIYKPDFDRVGDEDDLRGGRRLPENWSIQWNKFLHMEEGQAAPQFSRNLDTQISKPLGMIPRGPMGTISLAGQNLLRGNAMGLPSGQSVARAMGFEPLAGELKIVDEAVAEKLPLLAFQKLKPGNFPYIPYKGFEKGETPLWFYILKEAEVIHNGKHLGPVGAHIVAEVFVGLLISDPNSYLNLEPGWRPSKERVLKIPRMGNKFELRDIITYAGMPITKSDLEKNVH